MNQESTAELLDSQQHQAHAQEAIIAHMEPHNQCQLEVQMQTDAQLGSTVLLEQHTKSHVILAIIVRLQVLLFQLDNAKLVTIALLKA